MVIRTCRLALYATILLVVVLLSAVIAVLSHSGLLTQTINNQLAQVHVNAQSWQWQWRSATLVGQNIRYTQAPDLNIPTLNISLGWRMGLPSLGSISTEGISLNLKQNDAGWQLNGWQLPQQQQQQFELSIPWWLPLPTEVSAINTALSVQAQALSETVVLEQANLRLLRLADKYYDFSATGSFGFQNQPERLPVLVRGEPSADNKAIHLSAKFDHLPTSLLEPIMPTDLGKVIDAEGRLSVAMSLGWDGSMGQPQFTLLFGEGEARVPGVYQGTVPFKQLSLTGWWAADGAALHVSPIMLQTVGGATVSVAGKLAHLDDPEKLHIDVRAQVPRIAFADFLPLLPDVDLDDTVGWLRDHIDGGVLHDIDFVFKGGVDQAMNCAAKCGYGGTAWFEKADVRVLDNLPVLYQAGGDFELREDKIYIHLPQAELHSTAAQAVTLTFGKLFRETHIKPELTVNAGTLKGNVQRVIEMIGMELEDPDWFGPVQGEHVTKGWFKTPLGDDVDYPDATFDLTAQLRNVGLTVPDMPELVFSGKTGVVNLTEKELVYKGQGTLGGAQVSMTRVDDLTQPGERSETWLEGEIPLKPWEQSLRDMGLRWEAPLRGTVQVSEYGDEFRFDLASNASANSLTMVNLKWHKPPQQELHVELLGNYTPRGTDLDQIIVGGYNVEVLGRGRVTADEEVEFLNFAPFKVGPLGIQQLDFRPNMLEVVGGSVDLRPWWGEKPNKKQQQSELPEQMEVQIVLDRLHAPGGQFAGVSLNALRQGGHWQSAKWQALLGSSGEVTGHMDAGQTRQIYLHATDAGRFLRLVGAHKSIEGGALQLQAQVPLTAKPHTTGVVNINDIRLHNAPVLAQLLGLLSLEQLTSGSGIIFNTLTFPFEIQNDVVKLSKVRMDGPAIGITGDGTVDTAQNILDWRGKLVPVAGLNKVVSSVPLLGTILTGSQEGLVVADFSVKGPLDSPRVGVNPISVVTPGLVKDIFSVLKGTVSDEE